MDFLLSLVEIALFLAITTILYLRSQTKSNIITGHKITSTAPEIPGAWPIIGHLHLLRGQAPLARIIGAMVDKHGPIFSLRLGSHQGLVVSNWEMIKQCFTTNDLIFVTRPSMAVGKYLGYDNAVFALAPYGPYWRDVRKMVTLELLTAYRLEKLKHIRISEVEHFIKDLYSRSDQISSQKNEVVTMNNCVEEYTFNIILRTLASKRFSEGRYSGFKEAIKEGLYYGGVFVLSDAIPWLECMDIGGHVKGMKRTFKEIDKTLEEWVQERIEMRKGSDYEQEAGESDFMDVMLSAILENESVSGYKRDTIIKATLLILILTGSESTAETLIWALSLLLNNQQSLKLAQQELDKHVGTGRWVEESDINDLNYLQAIVKETFRLYPPGPLNGPREALEDCQVGGYHVPKGTRLIVNLWKLHRDPNVWSEPDKFRPERFLDENIDVNFKGQCFEYIPFSSGRRMCPGMTFGLQVVHLALARLIQGFDMSTPLGLPVDMGEGLGIALPKLKPLEVILTPRLPQELY
uniref:Flavonoid-6-hydroxylase n=1 Tax=Scoparia dulcis TaxID=107240 RepID=A0A1W7HBR4_SCODU